MKPAIRKSLTVLMVALVAVVGSIGGRAAWDAVTAQEDTTGQPPTLEVTNEEATKSKFVGEILGVFIGPYGTELPDKFTSYDELCGDKPTLEVEDAQAGELWLDFALPEPYKLDEQSLNTGVIACGDVVYAVRWEYSAVQDGGVVGRVFIARSLFSHAEFDVSVDRVSTQEINDREAVVIEPLSENGIASQSGVIFPGESSTTIVGGSSVPMVELLKVAGIVAEALKLSHQ